jgi:hypothetical protein
LLFYLRTSTTSTMPGRACFFVVTQDEINLV